MSINEHQDVRTTLTLDEDVAAKLKAEARRTGKTFKETVNAALRRSLSSSRRRSAEAPFQVEARDLGRVRPGLSFDSVSDLVEQLEGPQHR
jgi:Arc/MetJ family transcription regulator